MMSHTIDLPSKLIDYLNETRPGSPPVTDPDQPLQIDSLGLIRLIAFLESELHIRVEDEELLVDNFATPRALANLIRSKTAGEKQPGEAAAASSQDSNKKEV